MVGKLHKPLCWGDAPISVEIQIFCPCLLEFAIRDTSITIFVHHGHHGSYCHEFFAPFLLALHHFLHCPLLLIPVHVTHFMHRFVHFCHFHNLFHSFLSLHSQFFFYCLHFNIERHTVHLMDPIVELEEFHHLHHLFASLLTFAARFLLPVHVTIDLDVEGVVGVQFATLSFPCLFPRRHAATTTNNQV